MHQGRNVLLALAQGRDGHGKDVQPEPEVFTEGPRGDHAFQVAVGGRDDADVHGHGLAAAHAFDLVALAHVQKPDLRLGRQFADLVQEDGPAVGPLEPAAFARGRAGEGPLLVTEELAVDERVRNGSAIDLDERAVAPRRELMDGVGQNLLAHAGFAQEQHRRLQGRHLADLGHDLAQPEIRAHDVRARQLAHLGAQKAVVVVQEVLEANHLLVLESVGHGDGERFAQQAQQLHMLRKIAVRATDPDAQVSDARPWRSSRRIRMEKSY
jgi:hypothetical protein